jgi:hypothetical protein
MQVKLLTGFHPATTIVLEQPQHAIYLSMVQPEDWVEASVANSPVSFQIQPQNTVHFQVGTNGQFHLMFSFTDCRQYI